MTSRPLPDGQVDVEQDDVGGRRRDRVDRFGDVAGLRDHSHAVPEFGHDARAEELVVVDYDDGDGCGGHEEPFCGRWSEISVPFPGLLLTAALPPARSIRATTDSVSPRRSRATAL